jgi:hypothetical protein
MEDPVADAILNQYFRRLEHALSVLPAERREQIVEDLRAHIEDALGSEPDQSEATVLAVLDRVGDPDDIAQEAVGAAADEDAIGAPASRAADISTASAASASTAPRRAAMKLRLLAPMALALAALVVAILALTGGSTAAAPDRTVSDHAPGTTKNGWLPSGEVSGGGGVDSFRCSPQTMTGSESTAALETGATRVGSGSTDGLSWSVWSKNGVKGGAGLEEGGVIIDGVAHGLCAGFPNPAEMELLDPGGGGDAIAYGVVGYRGVARVAIYTSTAGTFDADKLVGSTTSQLANGVGFFITRLSQSGCDFSALELNTASANYATEHNLGFATSRCSAGQLVPISDSQGIWELPTKDFPNHYGSEGGGRLIGRGAPTSKNGWLPSGEVSGGGGVDSFRCSPQTMTGSESAGTLEADTTQVGAGTIGGHSWSVWSKRGIKGGSGLEEGGVIIDGVAHGLCAGFPNPAEMELLDPSGGGDAIAYGVVGYPGAAKVAIYTSTAGTFNTDKLVGSTTSEIANAVGFFITGLSRSACDLSALELNTASANYGTEHNLGFATSRCSAGQLVPISDSQGIWELPTKDFPNKYQSATGRLSPGVLARTGVLSRARALSRGGGDVSSCSRRTDAATSGSAANGIAGASEVASGTIHGHNWSLWSKNGEAGSAALEDAGVILDAHAYGLCPGFANPAELELIDPASGDGGIVIGVSGYPGAANVNVYVGTSGTFNTGTLLYGGHTIRTDGTGFFIGQLPKSACAYSSLELNVKTASGDSNHNLGFGACHPGKLTAITGSMGAW